MQVNEGNPLYVQRKLYINEQQQQKNGLSVDEKANELVNELENRKEING